MEAQIETKQIDRIELSLRQFQEGFGQLTTSISNLNSRIGNLEANKGKVKAVKQVATQVAKPINPNVVGIVRYTHCNPTKRGLGVIAFLHGAWEKDLNVFVPNKHISKLVQNKEFNCFAHTNPAGHKSLKVMIGNYAKYVALPKEMQ